MSLVSDAISNGYPIAGGHVDTPVDAELLNPAAFFSALRDGRTLAEAVALASPVINSTLRVIGDPLAPASTPLPRQGYEVYQRRVETGEDELVAVVPAGDTDRILDGYAANSEQWLRVAAVDDLGNADDEPTGGRKLRRAAFDGAGQFIAPAPNAPTGLRLERGAGGEITAYWQYRDRAQAVAPEEFHVYVATGGGAIDTSTPTHTVGYIARREHSQSLGVFAHGTRVRVRIGAASAAGSERLGAEVEEAIADAEAPDKPTNLAVETTAE